MPQEPLQPNNPEQIQPLDTTQPTAVQSAPRMQVVKRHRLRKAFFIITAILVLTAGVILWVMKDKASAPEPSLQNTSGSSSQPPTTGTIYYSINNTDGSRTAYAYDFETKSSTELFSATDHGDSQQPDAQLITFGTLMLRSDVNKSGNKIAYTDKSGLYVYDITTKQNESIITWKEDPASIKSVIYTPDPGSGGVGLFDPTWTDDPNILMVGIWGYEYYSRGLLDLTTKKITVLEEAGGDFGEKPAYSGDKHLVSKSAEILGKYRVGPIDVLRDNSIRNATFNKSGDGVFAIKCTTDCNSPDTMKLRLVSVSLKDGAATEISNTITYEDMRSEMYSVEDTLILAPNATDRSAPCQLTFIPMNKATETKTCKDIAGIESGFISWGLVDGTIGIVGSKDDTRMAYVYRAIDMVKLAEIELPGPYSGFNVIGLHLE